MYQKERLMFLNFSKELRSVKSVVCKKLLYRFKLLMTTLFTFLITTFLLLLVTLFTFLITLFTLIGDDALYFFDDDDALCFFDDDILYFYW
jgi:hypothetical protein